MFGIRFDTVFFINLILRLGQLVAKPCQITHVFHMLNKIVIKTIVLTVQKYLLPQGYQAEFEINKL